MTPLRSELSVELALRPRMAWAAALLGFLALPRVAGTAETITMTNYYTSPSGVYTELVTTAQTQLGGKKDGTVKIYMANKNAMGGKVGVGVDPAAIPGPVTELGIPRNSENFNVWGHLQVTGCIHLQNNTKRCGWLP
ncbi:MAG: hypothetical protein AAB578_00895 [Elusimicrobiota bacterium]